MQFILRLAQGVGGTEAHKPHDGNYYDGKLLTGNKMSN